jgi:hypothetical protein
MSREIAGEWSANPETHRIAVVASQLHSLIRVVGVNAVRILHTKIDRVSKCAVARMLSDYNSTCFCVARDLETIAKYPQELLRTTPNPETASAIRISVACQSRCGASREQR